MTVKVKSSSKSVAAGFLCFGAVLLLSNLGCDLDRKSDDLGTGKDNEKFKNDGSHSASPIIRRDPAAHTDSAELRALEGHAETAGPVDLDEDDLRSRMIGSAVRLAHPLKGHFGCGVVVSISRTGFDVVTADHVIPTLDTFSLICFRRDELTGKLSEHAYPSFEVVSRDADTDLAYLRVSSALSPAHSLPLASTASLRNSTAFKVWVVRWMATNSIDVQPAKTVARQVARRSKKDQPVSFWQLNRAVEPGMSGSALMDDRGKLIGIASGNSGNAAFFCDEQEIGKFFTRSGLGIMQP